MRLAPFNKAAPTAPAEPPACYRRHGDHADSTCPECGLFVAAGPYTPAEYARYFTTPMVAQPHVDIGRAGDATPSHEAARAALELADARATAARGALGDLIRRIALARSEAEADQLKAEELVVHDEVREAAEYAQKARARYNAEDRALGQRILAAQRKVEGRS